MKKPECIFFDYGDTLVHPIELGAETFVSSLFPYIVKNPMNATVQDLAKYYKKLNNDMAPGINDVLDVMSIQFMRCLLEYFNIELSIDEDETEYIIFRNSINLIPAKSIDKLLVFLKEKNIKTGIISNYPIRSRTMERRIKEVLPYSDFSFVMTSGDYLFKKPSSNIFEIALRKCNLKPEHVMHCGDSFNADVCGARAAGITPVWYSTKNEASTICISDWNELILMLN